MLICQVLQNLTRIYILSILAPPVINDTTKKDIIPLSEEQKEILGVDTGADGGEAEILGTLRRSVDLQGE